MALNQAILAAVSQAIKKPLVECREEVDASVGSVKNLKTVMASLLELVRTELGNIVSSLHLDTLVNNIVENIKSSAERIRSAAQHPSVLFPRLACGAIPLDPAKVTSFAKKYKALEFLDETYTAATDTNTNQTRSTPKTSNDVLANLMEDFTKVSDPVVQAIAKIDSVREKVSQAMEKLAKLEEESPSISKLEKEEQSVGQQLDRAAAKLQIETRFNAREMETEKSTSRGLQNIDVIATVAKAADMIQSVHAFAAPIEACMKLVKLVGSLVGDVRKEILEVISLITVHYEDLVAFIKSFASALPRLLHEVELFFVPKGLRSLVMKTAPETQRILSGLKALQKSIPTPESLTSNMKSAVEESQSGQALTSAQGQITNVLATPVAVVSKLRTASDTLPGEAARSAEAALKSWALNEGQQAMGSHLKEGLSVAASLIGNEDISSVVDQVLPQLPL